mmetsp:Transcript_9831/g.20868  ORF Transcript_9831/g.20868 Transcript_9831/m.20868 type:complete len:309 (+) Transcript_9831:52-978(+)
MRVSMKKKLLQKIRLRSSRVADQSVHSSSILEDSNSPSSCGGRDRSNSRALPKDLSRDENLYNENLCVTGKPSELMVQDNIRSKVPSSSCPELSKDVAMDVDGSDNVSDTANNVDAQHTQQESFLSILPGPQNFAPAVPATTEPSHTVYSHYDIYHHWYPHNFQISPQVSDAAMITPSYIPQVHYVDPNFHPAVLDPHRPQADQIHGAAFSYPQEDSSIILDASMQEVYVSGSDQQHFDQALHLLDLSSSTTAAPAEASVAAVAAIDDPSMQARKEALEATAKLFGVDHPDTRLAVQSMQRHAIRMMG